MSTNITDRHRQAFEAITSGQYGNFALFSCFVNGTPAAAVVSITQDGDTRNVTPLFISVTDDMVLTDHEGREPETLPPWT
jgi:hypothetical protein